MAIKDQCEHCRNMVDGGCTVSTPVYDATSCSEYKKRIVLEKNDDAQPVINPAPTISIPTISGSNSSTENEVAVEPGYGDIHGWLSFFLIFFVGIGSVGSLIMSIVMTNVSEYDGNWWLAGSDIVFAAIYMVVGIFTLISFYKKKPDAVFLGRFFIILCFLSNVLALVGADETTTSQVTARMVRSLVWCCIWFVFTYKSKQINELFPKEYRKSNTLDYILIGVAVLVPLVMIGIGVSSAKANHTEMETQAVAQLTLGENEYTDGRIVLTIPDGTDCDETQAEQLKVFTVSDAETGAEATVVSDYDTDVTKKNFNDYWRSWKPDELSNLPYEVVKDEKQSTDNRTIFYKLVRVELEQPVDWEFSLVFDHETGKVCLVSCYSSAEVNSPAAFIINNLRFL